jgi:dipeptidyl aminopeptidase/acylaminoacyl peptidase
VAGGAVTRVRAAAALALAPVALALWAGAAQATFPGANGAIAYTFWGSDPDVSAQELRIRRPGAPLPTTIYRCVYSYDVQHDPPCHELTSPSWSPDGSLVAATEFGPVESGEARLVILRSDGSELRRLPPLTSIRTRRGGRRQTEADPAWSPDGSRLVFTGQTGVEDDNNRRSNVDLYVVNTDGTGLRRLTRSRAGEYYADWSAGPDGGRIAFTRNRNGRENVYTMRPDGSDVERVTPRGGSRPSWSPDGSKLAFERRGNIYVVGTDGRGPRRLTRRSADSGAVWSPDGRRIAFTRTFSKPEVQRIYTIGSNGHGLRMVTSTTRGMPLGPIDWQPLPRPTAGEVRTSTDITMYLRLAPGATVTTYAQPRPEQVDAMAAGSSPGSCCRRDPRP